jgi:hypothetical protein
MGTGRVSLGVRGGSRSFLGSRFFVLVGVYYYLSLLYLPRLSVFLGHFAPYCSVVVSLPSAPSLAPPFGTVLARTARCLRRPRMVEYGLRGGKECDLQTSAGRNLRCVRQRELQCLPIRDPIVNPHRRSLIAPINRYLLLRACSVRSFSSKSSKSNAVYFSILPCLTFLLVAKITP